MAAHFDALAAMERDPKLSGAEQEMGRRVDEALPRLPIFERTMSEADKAPIRNRAIPDRWGRALTSDGTIWQDGVPVADVDYLVELAFGQLCEE